MNHTLLTAATVASLIAPVAVACDDDEPKAPRHAVITLPGEDHHSFVWRGMDDLPAGIRKHFIMPGNAGEGHRLRWLSPGDNEMHFGHALALPGGEHGVHAFRIGDGGHGADVKVSGRIEIHLPGGKVKVIEFGDDNDNDDHHGHDDHHDDHADSHGTFRFDAREKGGPNGGEMDFTFEMPDIDIEGMKGQWHQFKGHAIEIPDMPGMEGLKGKWLELGDGQTIEIPDIPGMEGLKGKWLELGEGGMGMTFDLPDGADLEDLKARFGKGTMQFFSDGNHEGHMPKVIREQIKKHMKDAGGNVWFTPRGHDAEADVHVEAGDDGTYQIWVEKGDAEKAEAHSDARHEHDGDDRSDLEERLADLQRKLKQLQKAIDELSRHIGD